MPVNSFEDFYHGERDGLFGALALITGSRFEAEVIAQDAFLAVWQRWDRVAGMESPAGYLYRTAMNAFRQRRRRAALVIRRAVGRGPEKDAFGASDTREALVLTELLEFSSEEAGRALGIKAATVRALASQGTDSMRKTLRGQDE